jgi:transcription-repair coupling factor (superfamily II helicase)
MSEPLQRVLNADRPLTLAGVPSGFLPWIAADLARAAFGSGKGRAVVIAADEAAMRALADTAPLFAPDIEVLTFPAWDCHPYDRASPAHRDMAERLATLNALQNKREKPQLLVATANAASQRLLTPFRIRQLTRRIAAGERIERESLVEQMNALGYQRADTVAEHGEYAVRGSLIDVFPAGEELALRLDFFGDEVDSIRRFDPADQRSTDKAQAFTLMPASEGLLDAETIKRFRSGYRERFGATSTQDPLYQALSEGRRMAGMEHWLPLLEDKLSTLFDHLGENDLILRDGAADKALEARREAIEDYYENRTRAMASEPGSYRPLKPDALYLASGEWPAELAGRPNHLASPFSEPESASTIDFGVESARDFAPERAKQANVYEAVANHIA